MFLQLFTTNSNILNAGEGLFAGADIGEGEFFG
jgi:hypothetical protein